MGFYHFNHSFCFASMHMLVFLNDKEGKKKVKKKKKSNDSITFEI